MNHSPFLSRVRFSFIHPCFCLLSDLSSLLAGLTLIPDDSVTTLSQSPICVCVPSFHSFSRQLAQWKVGEHQSLVDRVFKVVDSPSSAPLALLRSLDEFIQRTYTLSVGENALISWLDPIFRIPFEILNRQIARNVSSSCSISSDCRPDFEELNTHFRGEEKTAEAYKEGDPRHDPVLQLQNGVDWQRWAQLFPQYSTTQMLLLYWSSDL